MRITKDIKSNVSQEFSIEHPVFYSGGQKFSFDLIGNGVRSKDENTHYI